MFAHSTLSGLLSASFHKQTMENFSIGNYFAEISKYPIRKIEGTRLMQPKCRFSEDMELIDMVLPITALNYTSSTNPFIFIMDRRNIQEPTDISQFHSPAIRISTSYYPSSLFQIASCRSPSYICLPLYPPAFLPPNIPTDASPHDRSESTTIHPLFRSRIHPRIPRVRTTQRRRRRNHNPGIRLASFLSGARIYPCRSIPASNVHAKLCTALVRVRDEHHNGHSGRHPCCDCG